MFPRYVILALLLALLGHAQPLGAQQEVLRLHGSNTVGQRLVPALVRDWAAREGLAVAADVLERAEERRMSFVGEGRELVVHVHSHGTGTGYADLIAGRADFWMASRPANAAELAGAGTIGALDSPAQEHVIALDGLAVIVHASNRVRRLGIAQVRDVFSGRIRDWSALGGAPGPIALYARDDKSGTFDTFRSLVLRDATISAAARRFESTDELSASVAADPRAIGFVGIAGIGRARSLEVFEPGTLALAPSRLSVGTEDYALARRLFLYNGEALSPLAQRFVDYVLGPGGQRVVEGVGYVSQRVEALVAAQRPDVSGEYVELTRDAARLTLNFRFDSGYAELDNKAVRDVRRLADFLGRGSGRRFDVTLIGFADGSENRMFSSLMVSNDRADAVASALAAEGVGAQRVRGMGHLAPVASNDSEYGRFKNRRVEVWVRPRVDSSAGQVASADGATVAIDG